MVRELKNLVNGVWKTTKNYTNILNVLNSRNNFKVPDTSIDELKPFIKSINSVSKSGLHNPYKNQERYDMLGNVCFKTAFDLHKTEFENQLVNEIISTTGKTEQQAYSELAVSRKFLENFSGDQVRFLSKGFNTPGEHFGQSFNSLRWPYGSVSIISPFNFPLEIPLLQLMGSLFMGNKPLLKVDSRVSVVMDSMIKLLLKNGLPKDNLDFIHCDGNVMEHLLKNSNLRMTQFTGSSKIANKLSKELKGKIKIEGGGFDWKIIDKKGLMDEDLVYSICNKDAYSFSGQKCSAQSMLFIDESWDLNLFRNNLKYLANKEVMGPIITLDNNKLLDHINKLLQIKGSKLWFGNKKINDSNIPSNLGYIKPTAVYIPIEEINSSNFNLVCKEIFGPVQIITSYKNIEDVMKLCNKMEENLTAAVVSNNPKFINFVLGNTVNGTTYVGEKARTTGAPQNHWFGPCGDPRSAGIGSPEAIIQTWSSHREIIYDI